MKTRLAVLLSMTMLGTQTFAGQGGAATKDVDHAHVNPDAKVIGDYHVINYLNQRAGKIGVQILDRYESSHQLDLKEIKAEITHNGKTETVFLEGEGFIEGDPNSENPGHGASIFSVKREWVKTPFHANVKVWVPIDGKRHEVTLRSQATSAAPTHSGTHTHN